MDKLTELTLPALLEYSCKKYGNADALSFVDSTPITYSQLYSSAFKIAQIIQAYNIRPGEKVALFSGNMPNWGITYFGISLSGAVIVPILPDFHSNEVENILNHSECRMVFVCEKLYEKVEHLNKKRNDRIFIKINDFSPIPRKKGKTAVFPELSSLKEYKFDKDDTAAIIYTAGTTGYSKGVVLSHKNICSNVIVSSTIPGIKKGDHFLSVLPLSHSYECTIGFLIPIYNGAVVYYLSKPPAVSVLLPALKKVKPGVMLSVPLLIEKIVRKSVIPSIENSKFLKVLYHFGPTRKFVARLAGKKLLGTFGGKLYFFGIGGAAIAEDVERFLKEARFPYAIGYGLTETAPLIAGANAKNTRFRSTGPVVPEGEIKIKNPDPVTGEGEILYKGPNVMKGYYKEPEKTAEVLSDDGWFHTGDLGVIDEKGYLFIKGRVKTMILSPNGENVYPEAIESIINNFDFVEDSIVFNEEGSIVALVNLDMEKLTQYYESFKEKTKNISDVAEEYTRELLKKVNKQLNNFSRIAKIRHEDTPFEKTPKKTIKRYLYTKFKKKE